MHVPACTTMSSLVTAAISLIWAPKAPRDVLRGQQQVRLEFHIHDGAFDGGLPPVLVAEGHPDPD
jgi:hypothetical protein